MVKRADTLGHSEPHHYLWCASQHHKLDPTKPASKWDTAWRALRDEAGLPGLRFHDLRHTVVTRLLEAGEPDHVVESITGHLSRRMLEHYSHIRLKAKKAALDRLDGSTKGPQVDVALGAQRTRAAKLIMITAPAIASEAPIRSVRVGACPSINHSHTSDAAM